MGMVTFLTLFGFILAALLVYQISNLVGTGKTETEAVLKKRKEDEALQTEEGTPEWSALKREAKEFDGGVNVEWGGINSDSQKTELEVLHEIRDYTKKTAFWTRVTGIPVLIGMIIGLLMGLEKCS